MRFKKTKWGWWVVILDRKHFKVKLLRFKKGRECSFQKHDFRSELWLFLSGDGVMTKMKNPNSEKKRSIDAGLLPRKNSFEHIPVGMWHQFFSFEKSLVMEIQYGSSCEESDIVRL